MSTIYIKTQDVSPGIPRFTCEHSGRPIDLTTQFCDEEGCVCKHQVDEFESSSEFAHIKTLVDLFSR